MTSNKPIPYGISIRGDRLLTSDTHGAIRHRERLWRLEKSCMTPLDRVMRRVIQGDGCWEFRGAHGNDGYPRTSWNRRVVRVHRLLWEVSNGPVPGDLTLDHLCRNRWCVNPGHLEPVTNAENVRRVAAYRRVLKERAA